MGSRAWQATCSGKLSVSTSSLLISSKACLNVDAADDMLTSSGNRACQGVFDKHMPCFKVATAVLTPKLAQSLVLEVSSWCRS